MLLTDADQLRKALALAMRERDELHAFSKELEANVRRLARERDEARAALAGAENSLAAERKHSARLSRECQERHDELRAEVERLERLFQQTHGVHHSWVDARHKVAERQREACAGAAYTATSLHPEPSTRSTFREAVVRAIEATPLVTEGEP